MKTKFRTVPEPDHTKAAPKRSEESERRFYALKRAICQNASAIAEEILSDPAKSAELFQALERKEKIQREYQDVTELIGYLLAHKS